MLCPLGHVVVVAFDAHCQGVESPLSITLKPVVWLDTVEDYISKI